MEEYPIEEKAAQITRQGFVFLFSIVLMILSVFPLVSGPAGNNLWLSVPGGVLMAISIASLSISAYRMQGTSEEMLRQGDRELEGMHRTIDLVRISSPSQYLH